mgnify:CR=1 FL=1
MLRARGVAYSLAKEGASAVYIANRTVSKAEELAAVIGPMTKAAGMGYDAIDDVRDEIDLIVHNTEVGMHPNVDDVLIDTSWFHEGLTVSDIVYNPLVTRLLREAEAKGARTHGGLGMFIYQGAYAFEYWTGRAAPVAAFSTRSSAIADSKSSSESKPW